MKIDPYKNKERWLKWKEKVQLGIEGLSQTNSDIILSYLNDMECGINISGGKKGARSFTIFDLKMSSFQKIKTAL